MTHLLIEVIEQIEELESVFILEFWIHFRSFPQNQQLPAGSTYNP